MSNQLHTLIEQTRPSSARQLRIASVLLLSAYALALVGEWGLLMVTERPEVTFPFPWKPHAPYPYPDRHMYNADGWGDMYRMGQPRSFRLLGEVDRHSVTDRDAAGFRGEEHPGGGQIRLYGSSYFECGTTNAQTFGGQLQSQSGRTVTSRAWSGHGMGYAIYESRLQEQDVTAHKPLVLWGTLARLVQADHHTGSMRSVLEKLDPQGRPIPEAGPGVKSRVRDLLKLPGKVEGYLKRRSPAAREAKRLRRWLPPMAFDPIWGDFRATRLTRVRPGDAMLFHRESVEAVLMDEQQRGMDVVLEAARRVHAYYERLGVQLVMVFAPGKYQMFHDAIEPPLHPAGSKPRMITTEFARAFEDIGIPSIDLYPGLHARQFDGDGGDRGERGELLYRQDDTHWNDRGMQAAASIAVAELRARGFLPPTPPDSPTQQRSTQ